jgi:hypothetical protein
VTATTTTNERVAVLSVCVGEKEVERERVGSLLVAMKEEVYSYCTFLITYVHRIVLYHLGSSFIVIVSPIALFSTHIHKKGWEIQSESFTISLVGNISHEIEAFSPCVVDDENPVVT